MYMAKNRRRKIFSVDLADQKKILTSVDNLDILLIVELDASWEILPFPNIPLTVTYGKKK